MLIIPVAITALLITPPLVSLLWLGKLFRVPDLPAGIYDNVPRWWSKIVLPIAGVRLRVYGHENMGGGAPRVYLCNHVSWFDIPAMAATIPHGKFVAKADLFSIPFFGWGMGWANMVRLERENRKAAFASYEVAAKQIRAGASAVVFPEGTRGHSYELRPFKKGPLVLAIASGAPIVPVVIRGTREVMPRDSWRITPGIVELHFLEPVPTEGCSYEERDRLRDIVYERMAAALNQLPVEHAHHS